MINSGRILIKGVIEGLPNPSLVLPKAFKISTRWDYACALTVVKASAMAKLGQPKSSPRQGPGKHQKKKKKLRVLFCIFFQGAKYVTRVTLNAPNFYSSSRELFLKRKRNGGVVESVSLLCKFSLVPHAFSCFLV